MRHACGCVTVRDEAWGVTRSQLKCAHHGRPQAYGRREYEAFGLIDAQGLPNRHAPHRSQFEEAFGPLPQGQGRCLEIGAGCSGYVEMVREAGYEYHALETSDFAADWLRRTYGVPVIRRPWSAASVVGSFEVVIAAHVLEHLADAPGAVDALSRTVVPGGRLYVIVPDDEDLLNSDHRWFFTVGGLGRLLAARGFASIQSAVYRRVAHESFIYMQAVRS